MKRIWPLSGQTYILLQTLFIFTVFWGLFGLFFFFLNSSCYSWWSTAISGFCSGCVCCVFVCVSVCVLSKPVTLTDADRLRWKTVLFCFFILFLIPHIYSNLSPCNYSITQFTRLHKGNCRWSENSTSQTLPNSDPKLEMVGNNYSVIMEWQAVK